MNSKTMKLVSMTLLMVFVVNIFLNDTRDKTFAQEIVSTIIETTAGTEIQVSTNDDNNTAENSIQNVDTNSENSAVQQDNNITNTVIDSNDNSTSQSQTNNESIINTLNTVEKTGVLIGTENTNNNEILAETRIDTGNILNTENNQEVTIYEDINTKIENDNFSGETLRPIEIINPYNKIKFSGNLISIDSINSYNVSGGDSTYCSMIAKLNLMDILSNKNISSVKGIGSGLEISIGNAVDLIRQGLEENKLLYMTGSFDDFSGKLISYYNTNGDSIFDFYIYTDSFSDEYKGHRFVAFLASDGNIYVLDPIRGSKGVQPELMSEYINNINQSKSQIYMYNYGFSLGKNTKYINIGESLYVNIKNLVLLFDGGYIVPNYNDTGMISSVDFTKDITFLSSGENEITIYSGTRIKEKNNKALAIYNLGFTKEESGYILSGDININEFVDFGISGQHLIFSKPVNMKLHTDMTEGSSISILVKHAGEDSFGSLGITVDKNSNCSESGYSDNENNITTINGGLAEFYTCGASTFFVSTGTPVGMPPGCNTFKDPGNTNNGTGGLYGEYFAGYHNDSLGFFGTTSVGLTRIDPKIQFTANDSSSRGNIIPPAGGSTSDYNNYSSRRRGSIYVPVAGVYTFRLSNADDGAYLWLDNTALNPTLGNIFINGGGLHGPTTYSNTKYLNTGYVNILMYYGENGGTNTIGLERQGPGIARQYIPTNNLCSAIINSKPGGINGCNLWLKANKGFTTSASAPYASWRDDSGFGNDSQNNISTSNSPTKIDNQRNFNPIIRFQGVSGTPRYLIGNKTTVTTNNFSNFIVQKTRNTAGSFGKLLYLYDNTDPATSSANGANRLEAFMTYAGLGTDRIATVRANTLQGKVDGVLNQTNILSSHFTNSNQNTFFRNGSGTSTSSYSNQNLTYNGYVIGYGIGGFPAGDHADSDIAEIITCDFDVSNSGNLKNKIESYLAIKYGITLDQTIGQNYTLTTVTGRTTANGGIYNKDIAGIAMDSDTDLYQPKSQSINNTGDIIAESINPILNKKTLIRGNDSGNNTIFTNIESPSGYQRIARERKFQELNGDIGNVKVTIPSVGILSGSIIVMMIDNDGDFSNGGTRFISGILSGGNREFTANIANNEVITFGANLLKLWLKADAGVVQSAGNVSTWIDQNSGINNAIQTTSSAQPLIVNNITNFNPGVNFDNGLKMMNILNSIPSANTNVFVVGSPGSNTSYRTIFRSTNPGQDHQILLAAGTNNIGIWDNNLGTAFHGFGNTWSTNETALVQLNLGSTIANLSKNSAIGSTVSSLSINTNKYDRLGNFQGGSQQFGLINEVIIYDSGLNNISKNQIESYLAIKYGITLSQSVDGETDGIAGTSYRNNSGNIIRDSNMNNTYIRDIFGLGKDSGSTLDQRISKSMNTADIATISKDSNFISPNGTGRTSLTEGSYILIGNDGGSTGFAGIYNSIANNRMSRIRKSQSTNNPGSIYFGIPASSINIPGGSTSINMIISSDTTFNTSDTVLPMTLSGGYYYASTTIPNGYYISIAINNQAPYANNDSGTIIEDGSGMIYILINDTDPNNDILSITGLTNPSNGTVSTIGTGVKYTPNINYCGTDSFTYQAYDGSLNSTGIATVDIVIICTSDAPVAVNDFAATVEESGLVIWTLVNDTDPDTGDAQILNTVTQPIGGTATITTIFSKNRITFIPNVNFCGNTSFDYTLKDSVNLVSNIGTVNITVNCINDTPVAVNDIFTGYEDGATISGSVLSNDYDVDTGTILSGVTIVGGVFLPGFTLYPNGAFSYTPSSNFCGPINRTYRTTDGITGSNIATATINIICVNDTPTTNNGSGGTLEDIIFNGILNGTDIETSVVFSIIQQTQYGIINLINTITGVFQYISNQNRFGTDSFIYQVSDGSGGIVTGVYTITVNPVNDNPIVTGYNITINQNSNGIYNFLSGANDIDTGDILSLSSIITPPVYGNISITGLYMPNSSTCFIGIDTFTYKIKDQTGGISNTTTGYVNITGSYTICKGMNRNPLTKDDNYTGTEDQTLNISAIGVLTNDYLELATGINTTQVPVIPSFNYLGKPVSTPILAGPEGYNITGVLLGGSPNHVGYDAIGTNAHGGNFQNGGTYEWSFWARTATGSRSITPFFTDETNINPQGSKTFTIDTNWKLITVYNTYTNTIGTNPRIFITNDGGGNNFYIYDPLITKLELNTGLLTSTIVTQTTNGNISLSLNGGFSYTPNTNYCGIDTFTYRAKDYLGGLTSDIATGTINIACVNDAPVAGNDIYTGYVNTGLTISINSGVLANDSDVDNSGSQLQALLISGTSNGTLSLSISGGFVYTPNPYFIGTDTFSYYAKDPSGSGSTGVTVTINIIGNGVLCIYSPSGYTTGVVNASSSVQSLEYQFDYFRLEDGKSKNSGYYTTISVGNLTGSNGSNITNSNISMKADPKVTLAGSNNPNVLLNSTLSTYQIANIPYNFIYRNIGVNNLAGVYGSKLWIKVNIPAYQAVGTYNGTITYTLYEN